MTRNSHCQKNGKIVWNVSQVRNLMTTWVWEALQEISPKLIQKAFQETGISLKLDGSEEHLCFVNIHPFKKFYRSDR